MCRPDEVAFELPCGAGVVVRVIVDAAQCRLRDGQCMTAEAVAGSIWLAMREAELETARATGDSPARDFNPELE